MPGGEHGIPDWTPIITDLLKQQGYTTGQFGENHRRRSASGTRLAPHYQPKSRFLRDNVEGRHDGHFRWYADYMWAFVPAQESIQSFIGSVSEYPFQSGSSLNAAGINDQSLKAADGLKKLETLEYPRN